ncbi:outer membrane lipoprotein-sorting protein [Thermodesulfobacteriota bacterium]
MNCRYWQQTKINILAMLLIPGLLSFSMLAEPVRADDKWTGRRIMEEIFKRHELFPYVYEKQTIIMTDSAGNRDVREIRRFSRVERDGTVKYLLAFDNPVEVRGVALLAIRQPSGHGESGIYLPAFGKVMISNAGDSRGSHLLGTDFALDDLTTDVLSDFRYVRIPDHRVDKTPYFIVEAMPRTEVIERTTGYSLRRHFIRQDNFFIVRTEYYDRRGRFFKRQTNHDLKRVEGDMWRANMILMENYKESHKTLIKINLRIFSHDYVPPEIFTHGWLFENRHVQGTEGRLVREASGILGESSAKPPDDSRKTENVSSGKNNIENK